MPRRLALVLAAVVALVCGCGSSKHSAAPTTTESASTATPTTTKVVTTVVLPSPAPATTSGATTSTTVATPTSTSQSAAVQQTLCPSQQEPGLLADFGHSRTRGGAHAILRNAARVGFKNLHVERRSCNDYAVVLPGLKNHRQGRDLQREAASVGIRVSFDCRSHRVEGGLAAVFGHRRTRRAALRLRALATHYGFKNLQVQQDACNDWEVDLYGLKTSAERRSFAAEARSVGLRVVYEPG